MLCALLTGLAVIAAYPVVEMGVIDDWSYTRTALDLVRTGHVVYNGWATAMLGWQIVWAALFIKLIGYSMLVVRMSTLPLAMGCAVLMFSVSARCGLNWRNAFLATCTVVLSPAFVPIAASYMTDVPGLFSILLCLYLCLRALGTKTEGSAIAWLAAATGRRCRGRHLPSNCVARALGDGSLRGVAAEKKAGTQTGGSNALDLRLSRRACLLVLVCSSALFAA